MFFRTDQYSSVAAVVALSLASLTCATALANGAAADAAQVAAVPAARSVDDAAARRWQALAPAVFEHLVPERGLPHPVVMAMAQDGDGFMWFGTQGGLARWDGYRMRNFFFSASDATSLPGDFVQALQVDRQGRLWLGTSTDGVAMYDKLSETFVRYPAGPDGLASAAVSALAADERGGVWVGTAAGLDHIDAAGHVSHHARAADGALGPRVNQVRSLLVDRDGMLWIGSAAGLARRDGATGRVDDIVIEAAAGAQAAGQAAAAGGVADAVLALAAGSDGQLAFGTLKSGVGLVTISAAPTARLLALDGVRDAGGAMVLSLAETLPGQWWAATYGGGIIAFDGAGHGRRIVHQPAVPSTLANDRVAAVWRDRSGLVWAANERAIDTCNPANRAVDTVVDGVGLAEVSVTALMTDAAGRLWVGMADQGIDLVAPDGARSAGLRPDAAHLDTALPNRMTLSIVEAEPQEAWIGTLLGLYHTSAHGLKVTRVPLPQIDALPRIGAIVKRGTVLWLGTSGGLVRYDTVAKSVQAYSQGPALAGGLSDNRVTTMLAAPDGALWVGTRNGLNRFDPATGKAEQILAAPGNATALPHGLVNALAFDARGRLWVATNGGGIAILEGRGADGARQFLRLGASAGLPATTVTGLHTDPAGRMWASTVRGLVLIDAATLRVQRLGRPEGLVFLPYFAGAVGQTANGELVFGTSGGFAVVHPGQLPVWSYQPPLVLSSLRIDGRALAAAPLLAAGGQGLTVPAGARAVDVEVASLDYTASARNRYAFWLEGYDQGWVETDGRRTASYGNLEPGHYTLSMRGSNRDGVWSPHELRLEMQVLPAWYQTWWIRSAGLLAALGLAWGLYRWRVRALHRTQATLQSLVSSRTLHLEKVSAIVRSINRLLDVDALLHTILREASAGTGVDTAYALICPAGASTLAMRASWQRHQGALVRPELTLAQAHQRFVGAASAVAPDMFLTCAVAPDPGCVLVVRIAIDGNLQAYLAFENPQPFAHADLDLLIALREPFVSAFQKADAIRAIRQGRAEAEASTRAKSDFLANISHEIRTPMNAILGFAGLGSHLDLPAQPRDYFHKIGRAGHSLLGIINDVLDLSRIEAGKLELEAVPFDLPDTLSQIADLFSWRAAEKGLEFLVCAAPDVPPHLLGDPLRLSQVLINLVGNALKFTASGFIVLRVDLADEFADKSADKSADIVDDGPAHDPADHRAPCTGGRPVRLRFLVEDTGVGISEEQQGRLFRAFAQADTSTSRLYGGTGLGLAISQQLVQAMGGDIELASTPGNGSRFAFTVALHCQPDGAVLRQAPPAARGRRVLVVDDSAATREMLELQLRSFGFNARAVDSGAAALQLLRLEPYEVVLMDWSMPDMDGIEATRRIRRDATLAMMPTVLMVTEFTREQIRQDAVRAGIAAFLTKPVNPGQLLGAVLHALGFDVIGQAAPVAATSAAPQDAQGLHGARILVVDDNAINQQVARDVLQRVGVRVELADNGADAVRMIDQARYDAVLMDIQMPGMDGFQTTARIRERNAHAGLPVIAMTAHAVTGFRERSLAMGMNDYVTKPIDPDALYAVLAKWIEPDPARETGPDTPADAGVAADMPEPVATASASAAAGDGAPAGSIDIADALARLGGNARLLAVLLERFVAEFQSCPERLLAAIALQRYDDAGMLAHKVKGAAANLSMLPLQRSAGALELRLAAPAPHACEDELAAFGAALEAVIDEIQARRTQNLAFPGLIA